MSAAGDFGNPLRKFKLVFLGEQSGKSLFQNSNLERCIGEELECFELVVWLSLTSKLANINLAQ